MYVTTYAGLAVSFASRSTGTGFRSVEPERPPRTSVAVVNGGGEVVEGGAVTEGGGQGAVVLVRAPDADFIPGRNGIVDEGGGRRGGGR